MARKSDPGPIPADTSYRATGRRKEAVARVRLLPGHGAVTCNSRSMEEYFPLEVHRRTILKPFTVLGLTEKYNVFATLHGGGVTGQADALRHGIARALLDVNPEYRSELKKAGFLTRDPRAKERRKYGLRKARKAPQFSKR